MNKIKIKKELLPQRCDVCHQSDQFVPLENYCLRCNEIQYSSKSKSKANFTKRELLTHYRKSIEKKLYKLEELEDFQSNSVKADYKKQNQTKLPKALADYLSWWTIGNASISVITHVIIELYYVSYHITPEEHSPLWLSFIFRLSLLLTFILGILTFPRWYSILAFLSIGFIIMSVGGR